MLTLRSCPEDFRLAQSIGLCPGANATFSLVFFEGRFVVVGGTARDPFPPSEARPVMPVPRSLLDGIGGGGIS